jgi:hypothetical protein
VTVLPDILEPGLRIVFCGTAAGARSAELGQPYAGPGNKFWRVLEEVCLTPTRLTPAEFRDLPRYGIGLTDLAKFASGSDSVLRSADFDRGEPGGRRLQRQALGAAILPSAACLWRAAGANWREQGLHPALNLGRRQRLLGHRAVAARRRGRAG